MGPDTYFLGCSAVFGPCIGFVDDWQKTLVAEDGSLLYDFSQTTIPTDEVDPEWLTRPRKWAIGELRRFILYIGPISSIFDYLTFFIMLYIFKSLTNPALFHTGWFVESLLTQTLIVHIIRTHRIPFIQSRPSAAMLTSTLVIMMVGVWLPFSPVARWLGLVPLPAVYFLWIIGYLSAYCVLTHSVKMWFARKFGTD